jgi:hypothetical protein
MKTLTVLFLLGILFNSCVQTCFKYQDNTCQYTIKDVYMMIDTEKQFLYQNRLDTTYFVDSCFSYLSKYREKLISVLKDEELPNTFDKSFLIEDFFVYKKGIRKSVKKDYPFDYRAVLYIENSKCKMFLDINISKDCSKYEIERIRLDTRRDTTIQNWLSNKTELERQNLKNGQIMEYEDQYDIISKLTPDEKFCRIVINYFWNGFYGISEKPMPIDQKKTRMTMEHIAYLTFLTGNGYAF